MGQLGTNTCLSSGTISSNEVNEYREETDEILDILSEEDMASETQGVDIG